MLKDESVQQMIDALVAEEAAIDETMQLLTAKKERVQAALAPLKTLLEPIEPEFDGGLADACRQVLKKAAKPLTPLEIRDGLKAIGYDLTKHRNEMASIHSVLKRMAESKESKDVKKQETKEGTRYSWIAKTEQPPPVRSGRHLDPIDIGRLSDTVLNPRFVELMRDIEKRRSSLTAVVEAMQNSPTVKAMNAMTDVSKVETFADKVLKDSQSLARQLEKIGKLPKL